MALATLFGVLQVAGPASAGQRSPGQLTATQLALHKPVPTRTDNAQTQSRYIVRSGDTLSKIAKKVYGHANRWPALWWTNHKRVHNPNKLMVGQWLILETWHPNSTRLMTKALRHIPVVHNRVVFAASRTGHSSFAAAPPAATVGYSGGGGYQSCVIAHESGGDLTAQNPTSTASGLYGFLDTTWTSVTGLPGAAKDYSAAQQTAAFQKLYAEAGTSPWETDGCS